MSEYTVKSWSKFQHFKDRRPPWIKLYRDILDDMEWNQLSGDAAKMLVMLWLMASETDGYLPDINVISFRLRIDVKSCKAIISELKHYIDINPISERYQSVIPETETETETETEKKPRKRVEYSEQFSELWRLYGMRGVKKPAYAQWQKLNESEKDDAAEAISSYLKETKDIKYRVHFERYLSGKVFEGVLERRAGNCLHTDEDETQKARMIQDEAEKTVEPVENAASAEDFKRILGPLSEKLKC